ncbi:MAG: DUF748 domain-containing protein [Bdellovibrio sp.]|nr:DUF748 domain-containing protein [Bdellovibrio sp.]
MTKTVRRTLITLAVLLGLYCLVGFFLVPYIASRQITKNIEKRLGVTPQIGKISLNPFTFVASIENFNIPGKESTAEVHSRLQFEKFAVNLTVYPLLQKELHFKTVELKGARAQFIVYQDGSTNWDMKPGPETAKETGDEANEDGKEWTLTLESVEISKSTFDFWDHTHASPLHIPLGPLHLTATNISTSLGSHTSLRSLAISVGERGHLNLSGSMSVKPFTAQVALDVKDLPLDFLTAYLSDRTWLSLSKGSLDLRGELKYAQGNITFGGSSEVRDLQVLQENVEKPVVTWKVMELKDIQLSTRPFDLKIRDVGLDGLNTQVVLRADGALNFRSFMKTAAPPPTGQEAPGPSASESTSLSYLISQLRLSNAELDYADEQIKPHFRAHIHSLDGTILPISNEQGEKINVTLSGKVEAYGKFQGHGFLIPLEKPVLDFTASFHNIELTTFTPYSGRFAGYEISKGKLFLDINYKIVNNRIRGDNKVLLDQFTLGNKVESEKAGPWPLKFALALMKDRKGQIKFKLPVAGQLNDPSFSWGNLIWTAIKNLVVKIVASPFDFIASLVGGGKDLQSIRFEPGTTELTENESEKIAKIAEALADRPQLAMEIKGEYSQADIDALEEKNLEKKLEPYLKRHKGDQSKALKSFAQGALSKEELEKTSPEDLVKKLARKIPVSEDQLKALGLARGNVVMGLLAAQKVDTQRVYLLAGSKGDEKSPPQVFLTLKEKN